MPLFPDNDNLEVFFKDLAENRRRVESCIGPHQFVDTVPAEQARDRMRKFTCKLCGGSCDILSKTWYEQGLKHGNQSNNQAAES